MRYFCSPDDDDDFGFFGDDDNEEEQDEEEEYEDEEQPGEEPEEDEPSEDDGGDQDDPDNQQDDDDQFDEDLPGVDETVYASAEDFPNADAEDFEDDEGDWSVDDYEESAANIFGDTQFFGDTITTQLAEKGFNAFENPGFAQNFNEIAPGAGDTVRLFERDGQLHAFGFLPMAVLALLRSRYTGIDWSNAEVSVPGMGGEKAETKPLPEPFNSAQVRDSVDLRPYASPVGDQRQTSRCSAFAWTHATELGSSILQKATPRLSPNYTMLRFQQMQGDAKNFRYAYEGGEGTVGGPDPGHVLVQEGTCQNRLWPDDSPQPMADERLLASDAAQYRLPARPWPIEIDDVKKALSAGCPVHVAMNTGPRFSDVGRDGIINAAEAPSGQHGRHAMLLCGYTGNFYIVKNSWGTDWGDQGYCYIPKNVLQAADAEFVAVLLDKKQA
jgi:hypothetical protein